MRRNAGIFTNCLSAIDQRSIWPYSYHTDILGNRRQHYKATFVWTYSIALLVEEIMLAHGASSFPSFDELGVQGRQTFAVIGLFGIAAFVGVIAGALHAGIEHCRKVKDRSAYSVQVTDEEIPMTETTGLVGQDKQGVSIVRVKNCHPLRTVYPAAPIKTGFWIPIVGLAIFAIALMIKPNLFNEFAGNSPIVNGSMTNCTDYDIAQNATCVSIGGCLAGILTLVLPTPIVLAGIALLFHCKVAEVTEPVQSDERSFGFK